MDEMTPERIFEVIRAARRDVIAIRLEESGGDDDWRLGGRCGLASETVQVLTEADVPPYGIDIIGGCYHDGDRHIDHVWNVLPSGWILDVTADQFGEPDGWRIAAPDDPRYVADCPYWGVDG